MPWWASPAWPGSAAPRVRPRCSTPSGCRTSIWWTCPGTGSPGRARRRGRGTGSWSTRYLRERPTLAGVVWLLDVRHDPSKDDLEIQDLLIESGRPVLAALTKSDKLTRTAGLARTRELAAALGLQEDQVQLTSSKSRLGIPELGQSILATVGEEPMRTIALLGCAWALWRRRRRWRRTARARWTRSRRRGSGRSSRATSRCGSGTTTWRCAWCRSTRGSPGSWPGTPTSRWKAWSAPAAARSTRVARLSGISAPGLALVTLLRRARGRPLRPVQPQPRDPQPVLPAARDHADQPPVHLPAAQRAGAGQRDLPVRGAAAGERRLHLLVPGPVSEDWQNKQRLLDRERGRVAARSRVSRPDSGGSRRALRRPVGPLAFHSPPGRFRHPGGPPITSRSSHAASAVARGHAARRDEPGL